MSAPDDAARAEHKRLFDAQVLKRMSGVKEKSQFLSQATHSTIVTCMETWNSLEPKAKKTGSHGGHAYNWAKKYAVVISGEQPVLVFKPEVPVGEEAAGGTPELNTALDQLKLVSHQGSAFDDLYAVHVAGVHCKARAFQNRVSAKFGKSIPGWAVLLLAETCPVCVRKLPRKTTSAGHQPILTKGLGSRGQVEQQQQQQQQQREQQQQQEDAELHVQAVPVPVAQAMHVAQAMPLPADVSHMPVVQAEAQQKGAQAGRKRTVVTATLVGSEASYQPAGADQDSDSDSDLQDPGHEHLHSTHSHLLNTSCKLLTCQFGTF